MVEPLQLTVKIDVCSSVEYNISLKIYSRMETKLKATRCMTMNNARYALHISLKLFKNEI